MNHAIMTTMIINKISPIPIFLTLIIIDQIIPQI
jgi:hypothetical protein